MRKSRWTAALACVAFAVPLACGGDDSGDGQSAQTPPPPPPPPPAATTDTEAAGATGGSGATEPGAELKLGETAHVKWQDLNDTGPFEVDVTALAIEKASADDFKDVTLDEDQKNATPYYVKAKIENAGSKEIAVGEGAGDPDLGVEGIDDRGQEQGSVTFIGDFPPCEDRDLPKKGFAKGKSYETCLVFLVPGGGSITEVRWTGSEEYVLKPVVWK